VNGHWDLHISSEGNNTESGFHTRGCGANGDAGSNAYSNNSLYYNCKRVAYAADVTGRVSVYVVVTAYTGPYAYGRYLMRRDYPTLCTGGWVAVTPDLGASFQYVSDVVNCAGFDQLMYSFGPQSAPASCRVWEIADPYDVCGSQDQEGMIASYSDIANESVPDLHIDGSALYVATHSNKIYKSAYDPCTPFRDADVQSEVNDIMVYPNPAKDHMILELTAFTGTAVVSIYNMNGEMIMQLTTNDTFLSIDLSSLLSGNYIISTIADGRLMTKQFEVIK